MHYYSAKERLKRLEKEQTQEKQIVDIKLIDRDGHSVFFHIHQEYDIPKKKRRF